MARRSYRGNSVATSLSAAASSSDASLSLTDGSSFPTGTFPFVVTLDFGLAGEEKVLATARSGNVLTGVTRGYDGTAASAHSAGATARHTLSATDLDEANAHVNATTGVHGATGALVDTSSAQTLTNKSLTQAQTHGSPDTDSASTSLHHTLGTTATQAAAGNHTHGASGGGNYLKVMASPTFAADQGWFGPSTAGGGGSLLAASNTLYSRITTPGSASGAISQRLAGDLLAFSGTNIDMTCKIAYPSTCATGTYSIGVGGPGDNPTGFSNGLYVRLNLSTGALDAGVQNPGLTTVTLTGAPTTAVNTLLSLRIVYPRAGGTASVYANGSVIGTATVPALAAGSSCFANCLNVNTALVAEVRLYDIVITES